MLVVETVVRIRREHAAGKPIKAISRDLRLSRKVVRKAIRAEEGAFSYQRTTQPFPKIGPVRERLEQLLIENDARPRKDRLKLTRVWDLLVREGYDGSYDSVRRYAARWREETKTAPGDGGMAFVPLLFAPGEAFQFDFSHEDVEVGGQPMRVTVAHVRMCASRAIYLRAYPRETQEMVFDAHQRAFVFFGGVPTRGIYDNMKTAVDAVFVGKVRVFNRRFLLMADHYMFEPTACTPASGWEKGQVENQVKISRDRFFKPRLKFSSLEELNGWLEAECLITFDRNRYSVMAKAAKRTAQVRAYADRIVVRCAGEVVAEHARCFGRGRTIYDPWHYLPVLARKPGALRNGAPFIDWSLPPALTQLKRKLGRGDEADRRFVRVLAAVLVDGLEAVDDAVREALDAGAASDDLILTILARRREPPAPAPITTSEALALRHPPSADCARYDQLRGSRAAA